MSGVVNGTATFARQDNTIPGKFTLAYGIKSLALPDSIGIRAFKLASHVFRIVLTVRIGIRTPVVAKFKFVALPAKFGVPISVVVNGWFTVRLGNVSIRV
jgi:hypothetical protein